MTQGSDADRPSTGILSGLSDLLERLGDLAERGETLRRSGTFRAAAHDGISGAYGVTVRFGLGGQQAAFPTSAEVRRDVSTVRVAPEPEPEPEREPLVDLFEEEDHTLVVAEMPGLREEDVQLSVEGDLLRLGGARGRKRYLGEVRLPRACAPSGLTSRCRNGVVEIRCHH